MRTNIFFVFFLILADQFLKYIIRTSGGFYICNENLAFGINLPAFVFWIFGLAIIFFLFLAVYKKYFTENSLYFALILSGAVSNIIDRLHFGCVIDFIDLKFWPIFNLADIYISIGAILLILSIFRKNQKK